MSYIYEHILSKEAELRIRQKYRQTAVPPQSDDFNMYLPLGGIVAHNSIFNTQIANSYLLPTQAAYVRGENISGISISLIADIFCATFKPDGLNPTPICIVYAVVLFMRQIYTVFQWNDALAGADGYVRIMNISDASGSEQSSVIMPWTDHSIAYVVDNYASNVMYEAFTSAYATTTN